MVSVMPPAGAGDTMVMIRFGKPCAAAVTAPAAIIPAPSSVCANRTASDLDISAFLPGHACSCLNRVSVISAALPMPTWAASLDHSGAAILECASIPRENDADGEA